MLEMIGEAGGNPVVNASEVPLRRDVRDMLSEKYFTLSLPTTIFQILMSVLGIFGNSILLLICCRRKIKNSAMFYIGSLAVVDMFACVVVIPLQIVHSWRYYTYYDDLACKVFLWFKMSTLASSCMLFMGIAVDRYKAICHPFTWRHSGRKRAVLIPCLCILTGVICMAPELVLVGIQEYSVNKTILRFKFSAEETATMDFSQPSHVCEHLNSYSGSWELTTFLFVALAIFTVLVAVAIVCYGRIAWSMHQTRKQFSEASVYSDNRKSSVPLRYNTERRPTLESTTSDDLSEGALSHRMPNKDANIVGVQKPRSVTLALGTKGTIKGDAKSDTGEPLRRNSSPVLPAKDSRKGSVDMAAISKKQYDVARALMVVTIVFLVTWLPYWIVSIYGLIFVEYHIATSITVTAVLVFLEQLFFLNNAVNPIVYLMYSGEFRQQCKQLFRQCRSEGQ